MHWKTNVVLGMMLLMGCTATRRVEPGAAADVPPSALTDPQAARVTYLGNEAVLVSAGAAKILIDPLYFDWPDAFRVVSSEVRRQIFVSEAPFDGITAILVTHTHGDHFFSRDLLHYLDKQPLGRVFVTRQGYDKLAAEPAARPESLSRVTSIDLEPGDQPINYALAGVRIDAIAVPHVDIGRPNELMKHVAYRLTFESGATIAHLGDATPTRSAYAAQSEFWQQRPTDLVLVPFWFFTEGDVDVGRDLAGRAAKGMHVWPTKPEELAGSSAPLFLSQGETCRVIRNAPPVCSGDNETGAGAQR